MPGKVSAEEISGGALDKMTKEAVDNFLGEASLGDDISPDDTPAADREMAKEGPGVM